MDPSNNGNPAAPASGEPAVPAAPAANEPAAPAPAKPEQGGEPDYKAENESLKTQLEQEKLRRAGLDKKLSQMRKGSQQGGIDPNLPEDQREKAELENLRIYKAENQLKSEAKEILDRYPDFPKRLRNAIINNPRGFINTSTQTVEDAVLDLEEYIANEWDEHEKESSSAAPDNDPKKVKVASQNATVNAPGKPDLDHMTPDEVDAAIAAGTLTEKDLENHVRELGKKRANSK